LSTERFDPEGREETKARLYVLRKRRKKRPTPHK